MALSMVSISAGSDSGLSGLGLSNSCTEAIALCSWARYFTLTVAPSTQVYKWVKANLMREVTSVMDYHPIQGV